MFAFLAFGFKLIFGTLFGGALSYEPSNSDNDTKIIYSSLSSLLAVSLIGLSKQFPNESSGLMAGACVIAIFITIIFLTKEMVLEQRITLLFATVVGMIVGAGFIFQAAMLTGLVYFLQKHSKQFLNQIDYESDND